MKGTTDFQSIESLREALLSLQQTHQAQLRAGAQSQQLLDVLETLLLLDDGVDPFVHVFAALDKAFSFDQAMMLSCTPEPDGGERLECIVAEPIRLVGRRLSSSALLRKVLAGRVVASVAPAGEGGPGEEGGAGGASSLYLPVRVREHRGILILIREAGQPGFDRSHVEMGRRFSLLVSHALAARYAHQSVAESQRLLELAGRLRRSEQEAQRSAGLLQQIVDHLPVGLAVQDARGTLVMINGVAAEVMPHRVGDVLSTDPRALLAAAPEAGAEPARRRGDPGEGTVTSRREQGPLHASECEVLLQAPARALQITSKPVRVFDEEWLLTAISDISDRKRYEQELSLRAFHDDLTGLPNRALMQEIVARALNERPPEQLVALAFIDLDNFKQVNDFYSHAVGDALLRAVAERVRECIRPADVLSRISGDEFLLLVNPLASPQDLPPIIERVMDSLKQPFVLEGHQVLTSASVGASIAPMHGSDYESLRRSADNAMYRAKQDRKGSAQYFNPAMGTALTARMELEQRLRVAIREKRFRAALQPKVDLGSGRLVGFEALIRWIEPDGQVIMPGVFIEVATELGLLDQLTHFMLDEVVTELPGLKHLFGEHITVSVNIGAQQASDVPFMRTVMQCLGPDVASNIILELTEDALVAAARFQRHVLPELRARGVRVSIDDFGTGYSSLAMLSDEIADEVKIDRAFITDVPQRSRSQGILRAIESLCRALHISVVAEGVETRAELDYLRAHSTIRCAQGYWFSKPVLIEELRRRPESFQGWALDTPEPRSETAH